MKLTFALAGLAMLGGIALSGTAASAMPIATPGLASQPSNVQQADYVCNPWHCWNRPFVGDGYYYHPHYYGGWGWHGGWGNGWHHRHHGWGYGGWHRWHRGWGYGGWHRWHHWHGW